MLRGLPSGGPCRPGCKEAGWQGRAWPHLLKTERTSVGCEGGGLQHEGTVAGDLGGQAGSALAAVLTSQCLVVRRRAQRLGRVRRRVLCRVGCCWHPWLRGHGVVALVRRPGVAGWHTWRLRVRGVHHRGGRGGGDHRCEENPSQDRCQPSPQLSRVGPWSAPTPALGLCTHTPRVTGGREGAGVLTTRWPAAHLVEVAAGAGEADDDRDDREHEDGQADGYSRPKPAKEPLVSQASRPRPDQQATPHHSQGHPSCQRRLGATQCNFQVVQLESLSDCFLRVKWGCLVSLRKAPHPGSPRFESLPTMHPSCHPTHSAAGSQSPRAGQKNQVDDVGALELTLLSGKGGLPA